MQLGYYAFSTLEYMNARSYGVDTVRLYPDSGAMVVPYIYIGSLATALTADYLTNHNIQRIINISGHEYDSNLPVTVITMEDTNITPRTFADYETKFDIAVAEIADAVLKKENVLVHCAAGINRSATAIALYLIEHGLSFDESYMLLAAANQARGVQLLTNPTFVRMLLANESYFKARAKK